MENANLLASAHRASLELAAAHRLVEPSAKCVSRLSGGAARFPKTQRTVGFDGPLQ